MQIYSESIQSIKPALSGEISVISSDSFAEYKRRPIFSLAASVKDPGSLPESIPASPDAEPAGFSVADDLVSGLYVHFRSAVVTVKLASRYYPDNPYLLLDVST